MKKNLQTQLITPFKTLVALTLTLSLISACSQKPSAPTSGNIQESPQLLSSNDSVIPAADTDNHGGSSAAPHLATKVRFDKAGKSATTEKTQKRYIALRHNLSVESNGDALSAAFDATVDECEKLGCDILNATFNRGNRYAPPSANLSVRIPLATLNTFLSGLNKRTHIQEHQRQSEDKTDEVIDTEARLKNLTELRDRLRAMLAHRPGDLNDVLQVERELANTQIELDSVIGIRKALANETEKIAINIDFHAASTISENSLLSPIATAWNEAGLTLIKSAGTLITFVALLLPWLVLLALSLMLFRVWKRRCNRSKTETPNTQKL